MKNFSKGFKNKVKNDYTSENAKRLSVLETQKIINSNSKIKKSMKVAITGSMGS